MHLHPVGRSCSCKDLTAEEKALFLNPYNKLLADKKGLEVCFKLTLVTFVTSTLTLEIAEMPSVLILLKEENSERLWLPADKTLYAGINGKTSGKQ